MTTSTSRLPPPFRSPRCASHGSSSAAPRPGCSSTRPPPPTPTSITRSSSNRSLSSASPPRPCTPARPWPLTVAPGLARDEDVQVAGAVHAFDADQLDVAGGRGAGDQRVRAGGVEPGKRAGDVGFDLAGLDDDQVKVGHQGERAAPLTGAVVEDDGAGLGDRGGAAGDHA